MYTVVAVLFSVFILFSVVVFFLSRWVFRKSEENPHRSIYYFRDCEWYIHPRTFSDRVARKLIHSPSFIRLADYCNASAVGIFFLFGIALFMFLLFA